MYRVQEKLANAHQQILEKERIILNLKNKVSYHPSIAEMN